MNGESLIKIAFTILKKVDKSKAQWSPVDNVDTENIYRKNMNGVGDIQGGPKK